MEAENGIKIIEAYEEHNRKLLVRSARGCCVFCLVGMPSSVLLECLIYPHFLFNFFLLRVICDLMTGMILAGTYTFFGKKHISLLGSLLALVHGVIISIMIYISEGSISPYYAGLIIVMAVVSVLIPWPTKDMVTVFLLILTMYIGACFFHTKTPINLYMLYSNLYFFIFTSTMLILANFFNSKLRFEEFSSKFRNVELKQALRKLEETREQLAHSEKMNALGILSSGIMHEVNNPLGFGILLFDTLIKKLSRVSGNEKEKEITAEIEEITDLAKEIRETSLLRIREITTSLKQFTHKNGTPEIFRINNALKDAMLIVSKQIKDIKTEVNIKKEYSILGAQNNITLVFVNFFINAAYALKEVKDRKPEINISAYNKNNRLIVKFRDNGAGIKKENLKNVFVPFFTTKPAGIGSGLGLSNCHTIIKNHGGELKVKSKANQFTEFVFTLPIKK
jgi:two-component system sensor histidine kinase PhcS